MAKAKTAPKNYKFPKDLGKCLKRLAELKKLAEIAEAKAQPINQEDAALREHLMATFKKSELKGATGSGIALSLTSTPCPSLEDWAAFYKYAKLKGNEDLLQHSVNTPAWRERIEAGKKIPGVKVFDRVSISVRKIS